jgi:hypothetical protein
MIADHGVDRVHAHRGCNHLPLLAQIRTSTTHPSYPFVIEVKRTKAIMAVRTACRPLYHLMLRPLRRESRLAFGPEVLTAPVPVIVFVKSS